MFENKKIKKMEQKIEYFNSRLKSIENELFSLRYPNGRLYVSIDTDRNKKSITYQNFYADKIQTFQPYNDIVGCVKVYFCEKFNTHLLKIDTDNGSRFISINKETGSKHIFGDDKIPTEKLDWVELKPTI
jgi:hypothetical protein